MLVRDFESTVNTMHAIRGRIWEVADTFVCNAGHEQFSFPTGRERGLLVAIIVRVQPLTASEACECVCKCVLCDDGEYLE